MAAVPLCGRLRQERGSLMKLGTHNPSWEPDSAKALEARVLVACCASPTLIAFDPERPLSSLAIRALV